MKMAAVGIFLEHSQGSPEEKKVIKNAYIENIRKVWHKKDPMMYLKALGKQDTKPKPIRGQENQLEQKSTKWRLKRQSNEDLVLLD